ncbi:MAG: hypothetical protein AAF483_05800 [Planctomycetota bacterium]
MSFRKNCIKLLLLSALVVAGTFQTQNVHAGGYPPFGAWAYGSGSPGYYGVARTRSVTRVRPTLWGGYGNIGFAATSRVYTRYRSYPTYSSLTYRVGFPRYYHRPFVVNYYTPAIRYYPVYYSFPAVTFPVLPVAPACSTPSTTLSVSVPTLLTQNTLKPQVNVANTDISSPTNLPPSNLRLVGTHPQPKAVPQALMNAADAILQAGGYAEAAQAYAALAVQFENNQALLERRFASQVLSGKFGQAEVILQLAELSQIPINGGGLGVDGLTGMLAAPNVLETSTEALAEHALRNATDPVALRTVATWLTLCSKQEKAEIFFEAAARLQKKGNLQLPAQAPTKSKLVSFP